MAFYAKGGTNAFLHITKGTDARGGINDGTIFHSSMPHVFVEKTWEAEFNTLKVDWNKAYWESLAHPGANRWSKGFRGDGTVFKDRWNKGRVANIPTNLQLELANKSNVILIEMVYDVGGMEYSTFISGLSIGNTSWLQPSRDQGSSNFYVKAYAGNVSNIAGGIGLTYGSYQSTSSTEDIPGMASTSAYGTSNIYLSTQVSTTFTTGYDPYYHRDLINAWSTQIIYSNKWDPEITRTTVDLGKICPVPISPYGHQHNKVFATTIQVDSGMCNDIGPGNRINALFSDRELPEAMGPANNGTPCVTSEQWSSGNQYYGGGRTVRGAVYDTDSTVDMYGNACYAYLRNDSYIGIPKKVRWHKLNLTYSTSGGYTIKPNPFTSSTKGVKIGSGIMEVNGISFLGSSNPFLFQTNPDTLGMRHASSITFSNHHYAEGEIGSTPTGYHLKQSGTSNAGDTISLGGDTSPSGISTIAMTILSGNNGWGCTSNTIFNSKGELWGPNSIPLTLRGSPTISRTFGGSKSKIDMKNKTATIRHGSLALGLTTSRASTVIFNIVSKDPAILFTTPGYYSLGMSENTDQHISLANTGNLSVESPHGIITLPINRLVPIVCMRGLSANMFYSYSRGSGRQAIYSDCHHDSVVWLKNLGNGNVEIVSTHTQRPGRFDDWGTLPVYAVPEFTLHVTKLS
ncbi:hypothetical protein [Proteus phage 2]|nr:hypothetical protein [Proteus phage 1]QNN97811.1 hypothetical protein [Proteus phage 2]